MFVKVFSEVLHSKINKAGRFDCGRKYFLVKSDSLDKALEIIRKDYDSKANAMQVAEEYEVKRGIIL